MCGDRIASQRHQSEVVSRQEKLSESVNSIAGHIAELSITQTSLPVSTRPKRLNLLTHFADLQEEIARMTTTISNPIGSHAFGAATKAAMESHLDIVANEQPVSQQATWSTPREPGGAAQDMSATSNIEHNTGNRRSRKRPKSPRAYKSSCGRKRIRCAERSTTSINDFFGGRIYVQTHTYRVITNTFPDCETLYSQKDMEHKTVFTYHPTRWLLRRGFTFGINALIMNAKQGWQYQMHSFRAVPDDSLIFEFCLNGNLNAVRSLLVRKEASPWDVNSYGWTPLHVSHLLKIFYFWSTRLIFPVRIAVVYLQRVSPYSKQLSCNQTHSSASNVVRT